MSKSYNRSDKYRFYKIRSVVFKTRLNGVFEAAYTFKAESLDNTSMLGIKNVKSNAMDCGVIGTINLGVVWSEYTGLEISRIVTGDEIGLTLEVEAILQAPEGSGLDSQYSKFVMLYAHKPHWSQFDRELTDPDYNTFVLNTTFSTGAVNDFTELITDYNY